MVFRMRFSRVVGILFGPIVQCTASYPVVIVVVFQNEKRHRELMANRNVQHTSLNQQQATITIQTIRFIVFVGSLFVIRYLCCCYRKKLKYFATSVCFANFMLFLVTLFIILLPQFIIFDAFAIPQPVFVSVFLISYSGADSVCDIRLMCTIHESIFNGDFVTRMVSKTTICWIFSVIIYPAPGIPSISIPFLYFKWKFCSFVQCEAREQYFVYLDNRFHR